VNSRSQGEKGSILNLDGESPDHPLRVILRIYSWGVTVDPVFFPAGAGLFPINHEALRCSSSPTLPVDVGWVIRELEATLLDSGELRGSDLKAVKTVTLFRCVAFPRVCEVLRVRSSTVVTMATFELRFPYPSPQVSTHKTKKGQTLPNKTFDDLMRAMTATRSHIQGSHPSGPTSPLEEQHPHILRKPTRSRSHHGNSSAPRSASE
jgi:hypothetical protein